MTTETNPLSTLPKDTLPKPEKSELLAAKVIGGHPFYKVDLRALIKKEITTNPDNSNLEESQVELFAQEQFEDDAYKNIHEPVYYIHNDVCLLLEPLSNGEVDAYITAFPSQHQFEELQEKNTELQQYQSVEEYQAAVMKELQVNYSDDGTLNGSRLKRRTMYVPFAQHQFTDEGIQTSMSAFIDQIIRS